MSRSSWSLVLIPTVLVILLAATLALVVNRDDTSDVSAPAARPGDESFVNSVGMTLVAVPAGTFVMGGGADADPTEQPARQVSVAPFYIGAHEVTQAQWAAVMGENPSKFKDPRRPVEQVSWLDVQAFIQELNRREGTSAYRLPTEAEWEYATRAGSTARYHFGDDPAQLDRYAWFGGAAGAGTRAVGRKNPNAWGLYDVHGNVWEWVQDCWHDNYRGAPLNAGVFPGGDCSLHVVRGGAWDSDADYVRSAVRGSLETGLFDTNVGFRIVRSR